MANHELLSVLKSLGYDNQTIRQVAAVTEAAELQKLEANSGVELTPMMASAKSPRHAAQVRELEGMVFTASQCKWRLPVDRPVSLSDLDAAIRHAHLDQRMAIKSLAHGLGLLA